MKRNLFAGLALFPLIFILAGCGSSDIDVVKNGTLPEHTKTTIGKAFDASFDSIKWTDAKGSKGERLVLFSGKISKGTHDSFLKEVKKDMVGVVDKTMTFSAGGSSYTVDGPAWVSFTKALKMWGRDCSYLKALNNKYGCSIDFGYFRKPSESEMVIFDSHYLFPLCPEEQKSKGYMDELATTFFDEVWKVGSPVEVRWIVTPDGKSIGLESMTSPAWQGMKYKDILSAIYE